MLLHVHTYVCRYLNHSKNFYSRFAPIILRALYFGSNALPYVKFEIPILSIIQQDNDANHISNRTKNMVHTKYSA